MRPRRNPLGPGTIIAGRYRIDSVLGSGGMGEVFRATQLNLERPVALKVMLPARQGGADAVARFAREAKVAAQLKHPGAVEIFDFGEVDGVAYIAMEMLSGTTLRALVDTDLPPLPLERALRIAVDIADVLVAAHAIGLVHRDLKPENVFVERGPTGGDRIVVVDFGLAFIDTRDGLGRMTQEGLITGTPDYLSPEQAQGRPVGTPTDIYAFGCMLFEMLTTMVPFRGHYMQVITQQLYAVPPLPSEVRRDLTIPRSLDELVKDMLRKEPGARPAAELVRDALKEAGPGRRSERAREYLATDGRAARMLSTYRPPPGQGNEAVTLAPDPSASLPAGRPLAIVGALSGDLLLGLGANGLIPYVVSAEQPVDGADAIYAPGATEEQIGALRRHGLPIVADAAASDMPRIAAMVKLGVDEVVIAPVAVEDLARKTWRAIRKAARGRKKEG